MAQTASTVLSAKEKLYGPGRLLDSTRAAQRMQKSSLINKGEPYDNDGDLESITALSYRRPPSNSKRATAKWTAATQQDTNLSLGHNDGQLKSLTHVDFTGESVPKVDPLIPEGIHDIHVADLAPRYMADKSIGDSIYAGSYQGKDSFRFWLKQVEKEGLPTQRRRKTTLYQKATHFNLGSSQERPNTETSSCFNEPLVSTSGSVKTTSGSAEGMTHSSVFRPGDYDVVTGPDEYISIQKKDYTLPSARELPSTFGAGISTKTKNPKTHITERKMAVSGETISALRELLIKQNQSEFQNPRDPTSINLTKAFVKFDVDRAGFITADQLVSACQSIGATQEEAVALLKECDKVGDGKINYIEFAKYLTARLEPVDEEDYTSIHMDSYRDTGSQQHSTDEECLGAGYHTVAHFQLGNSTEGLASVYNKDYSKNPELKITPRAPEPQSGKVIAQHPKYMTMGSGKSTKQAHYVPHGIIEERLGNIQLNSDRHARVSVIISCDKEQEEESRLSSVMRSSYRGVPTEPAKSSHFEQEDKKHLESDRALLNPPKEFGKTEFQRSYQQPTSDSDQVQTDTLEERSSRTRDNKKTHFILGSDPTSTTSEHTDQYQPKLEDISVPVAGKKQGIPEGYSIIPEQDECLPEQGQGEQEGGTTLQNVLRQRNYLKHINPRDPLNLNLRKCFLEYDKNLSGTVTVDELRKVCIEMKIGVDESTLQDLIEKCDRNQDGMIDYHEFSMYLSKKGLPNTDSKTVNTVFREDYKHPFVQRMTSMQKLVAEQEPRRHKPIHSTSFFRLDHSGETPKSTTRTDFIEPEQAETCKDNSRTRLRRLQSTS